MKAIHKNPRKNGGKTIVELYSPDESQKHPYLEQKLAEANKLLKKVGLPKELS